MQIEHLRDRLIELARKYPGATAHIDTDGDFFPVKAVSPFLTVDKTGAIVTDVIINT